MMDDRDVIERLEPLFPAPENALEGCLRLRDRRRRNQRIGAIAVAAIITAALVVSLVSSVDRSKKRPADTGPITPTNVSDLQLSWTAKTDADPRPDLGLQSLAQGDGSLYVVTGAHAEISAFSIDCAVDGGGCGPTWTGRLRMPAGACGPIRCVGAMPIGPAVTDGLVLVGSLHRLTAFPADCVGACRPAWVGRTDAIAHQAVVADDIVYVGTGGGHLYAFPVACERRCEPLWVSERQPTSLRVLGVVDGIVYADTDEFWGSATPDPPGYAMGYAFPADCSRGCRPLWTTRLNWTGGGVSLTASGDMVYVGGSADRGRRTLSAYRAACGIDDRCRSWTATLPSSAADILIDDDVLIVTVPDADQVRAFPLGCAIRCRPLWSATIPGVHGRPVAASGLVFLPSASGVSAVASDCGTGGATCGPAQVTRNDAAGVSVAEGRLFVRSSNGRVYGFIPRATGETGARGEGDVAPPVAVLLAAALVGSIALIRSRRRVS
jgi:outer membrane protein assembly factor BamB